MICIKDMEELPENCSKCKIKCHDEHALADYCGLIERFIYVKDGVEKRLSTHGDNIGKDKIYYGKNN